MPWAEEAVAAVMIRTTFNKRRNYCGNSKDGRDRELSGRILVKLLNMRLPSQVKGWQSINLLAMVWYLDSETNVFVDVVVWYDFRC